MIDFVPFAPGHLDGLVLQPVQRYLEPAMSDPEIQAAIALPELAYSALVDGRIVGAAGVLPLWPGRGQGWALIGAALPRSAWTRVTRRTEAALARAHDLGLRRIEATVLPDFVAGHRWVRRLGFTYEGTMRGYGADGTDYCLYARVA